MKLAFAHDTLMVEGKNRTFYSTGSFPYSIWKRYLKHFDEVIILSRRKKVTNDISTSTLSVSSGPKTQFIGVPNLSSIKGKILKKRQASTIIKEELLKADALIARLPSEIGKLAIDIAVKERIPYIIELVGCPYDAYYYYGNIKGRFYAPFNKYESRKLVKNSNYTVYVTKEYFQEKYPTNGKNIDVSNVNISSESSEYVLNEKVKKVESLYDRTLKIGMIGSLDSKYKGFDKAIKYLSETKPNSNNYEIHILGAGSKEKLLEHINKINMSEKVFFSGTRSSGEEVFKWLDDIDLYIQPSLTEGLPRALIEAMNRGCLAIGSNRGGIPELLDSQYLFDPYDIKSFNNSINKALRSKKEMTTQVVNNIGKSSEYSTEKLTMKRDKFLEKFISENF